IRAGVCSSRLDPKLKSAPPLSIVTSFTDEDACGPRPKLDMPDGGGVPGARGAWSELKASRSAATIASVIALPCGAFRINRSRPGARLTSTTGRFLKADLELFRVGHRRKAREIAADICGRASANRLHRRRKRERTSERFPAIVGHAQRHCERRVLPGQGVIEPVA